MIQFTCNSCGKRFRVADDKAGRKATCSSCKASITIPQQLSQANSTTGIPEPQPASPGSPVSTPPKSRGAEYTNATGTKGEIVIYVARLSWIVWIAPCTFILVSLASLLIAPAFAVGCMLPLTILVAVPTLLRVLTTEMTVTTTRVVLKSGALSRRTSEMQIRKIENVQLDQSIFDRVFDSGKLTVTGSGATTMVFKSVKAPEEFRRALLRLDAEN